VLIATKGSRSDVSIASLKTEEVIPEVYLVSFQLSVPLFALFPILALQNPTGMAETDTLVDESVDTIVEKVKEQDIVLFNDDVNTFDWVIDSLVDVCEHEVIQAEQCAHLVHFSGKCAVKRGTFNDLKPMCLELLNRGLTAEIH